LLAISLGALIAACVLLGIEMNRYGWKVKPSDSQRATQAASHWA
jgi:hypothetical protein